MSSLVHPIFDSRKQSRRLNNWYHIKKDINDPSYEELQQSRIVMMDARQEPRPSLWVDFTLLTGTHPALVTWDKACLLELYLGFVSGPHNFSTWDITCLFRIIPQTFIGSLPVVYNVTGSSAAYNTLLCSYSILWFVPVLSTKPSHREECCRFWGRTPH